MEGAPSTTLPAKRKSSKESAKPAAGGLTNSVGSTVRERQRRRRQIIQAKNERRCSSPLKSQATLLAETSYYGPPAHECHYCGAQFWYQERVKRSYSGEGGFVCFHLCCRGGLRYTRAFRMHCTRVMLTEAM
ncbi:hypothetical protein EJB05_03197 [Eragrostis curvula]|uniref:Uncharacterized protein n=1 Tax=Eragrostis curvula TaxID=38414 RepID=A0A5J9WUJ2_9POAL|nr:hypothetical protein EJB05_03197 [Eragrostis curvula]